jgi:hypothetical protein
MRYDRPRDNPSWRQLDACAGHAVQLQSRPGRLGNAAGNEKLENEL